MISYKDYLKLELIEWWNVWYRLYKYDKKNIVFVFKSDEFDQNKVCQANDEIVWTKLLVLQYQWKDKLENKIDVTKYVFVGERFYS